MMYCQDCVELLADYVDGLLPVDEKEALEEHLSFCPPCVTFVRTYKATSKVARRHLELEMPKEVARRLQDFIRRSASRADDGTSSQGGT